jgi:hypothetical protein
MIDINFWDDFYEDGFVPEGEIQKTYAYVEEKNLAEDATKKCLENILGYIKYKIGFCGLRQFDDVKFSIEYYDSKLKYPNLVGTEHEYMLFTRWELRMVNITHKLLEEIMEMLEDSKLTLDGIPLNFYSES